MKRLLLVSLIVWLFNPAAASPDVVPTTDSSSFGTPCPYPDSALKAKAEGSVMVAYHGGDDGKITDVQIVQSSGNAELDNAALQCVGRWQFDPKGPRAPFYLGKQRLSINWRIPSPVPGKPPEPPAGYDSGIPHVCLMDYPLQAVRAGVGGTTTVAFRIKANGKVDDIKIDTTSGSDLLDRASLGCVKYWRYRPAVEKSKPVDVPWKAEIKWRADPTPLFAPVGACTAAYPVKTEQLTRGDGRTDISIVITGGSATEVSVAHSSGDADLDEAAAACVRSISFAPMHQREGEKEAHTFRIDWKTILSKAK